MFPATLDDQNLRLKHVEDFYELLSELERKFGGKRELRDCNGRMDWPQYGVYFFFEPGEYRRADPQVMRVVRVGTHAVSDGSRSTLWNRLRQHRGNDNGNGNHRGSVFRRHVGEALIKRAKGEIQVSTWGVGNSAPKSVRDAEAEHERRVSEYIGRMPFLWLEVADASSKLSDRAVIEANGIALLCGSDGRSPLDPPSDNWLGRYSREGKIRDSGLWNVNYVGTMVHNPEILHLMARYLENMRA